MNILHDSGAPVTSDSLTEAWRVAHRAAVAHLIASSYTECGCTAHTLCAAGQRLEDRCEDLERRMGLPTRLAVWALTDERQEGQSP